MKTEKLYYKDAYLQEFEAKVLSVIAEGGVYEAVLDKTAFFPEKAGQHSDKGTLNGISVLNVREENEIIYHRTESPLREGENCCGEIDFSDRFDKMQIHSAEHLASGIIHTLYGAENVGFHLGPQEVTFDTDLPVTQEMLDRVEALANRAIYENREITQRFPDADELSKMSYRSKLELVDEVRIVNIDGYDCCACCAPHVKHTGEIGVIKFIYSEKHKGGTRIYLLAGQRAYDYFNGLFKSAVKISTGLSAPITDIAWEVEKLRSSRAELEFELSKKSAEVAKLYAESLGECRGNRVVYLSQLDSGVLRLYANMAGEKTEGVMVALCGMEGDYKYVIKSSTLPVEAFIKEANSALGGKGGGRGAMAQGSFSAPLAEIENFFAGLSDRI